MMVPVATQRIKKLKISEISLVGEGDNPHADVLILKHRDIVGFSKGTIYADPENKKYPVDDDEHCRAAWSYINMPKNAAEYSSEKLKQVKGRIVAAWKRVIGHAPPSATEVKKSLGDCRVAAIAIAKAISEGGDPMDIEQLTEKLDQIEKSLEDVTKENELLKSNFEAITKERDALKEETEVLKAKVKKGDKKVPPKGQTDGGADDPDADDDTKEDDEDVMKDLPQAFRDRIEKDRKEVEDLKASIAKERDERDELVQIDKVRTTGLADAEKYGKLLHRVSKGKSTPEDADMLTEFLAKAKALQDGGEKLFQRIGKGKGDEGTGGDAAQKLDEAVAAIQKAKPSLTKEQAYSEAVDANPALYDAVRNAKADA